MKIHLAAANDGIGAGVLERPATLRVPLVSGLHGFAPRVLLGHRDTVAGRQAGFANNGDNGANGGGGATGIESN
jgi:hypothetical protein